MGASCRPLGRKERGCKVGGAAGALARGVLVISYGTHYPMLCVHTPHPHTCPSVGMFQACTCVHVYTCTRVLQALESTVEPAPTHPALYKSQIPSIHSTTGSAYDISGPGLGWRMTDTSPCWWVRADTIYDDDAKLDVDILLRLFTNTNPLQTGIGERRKGLKLAIKLRC